MGAVSLFQAVSPCFCVCGCVSGFVSGFVVVVELPIVCVLIEMDGWMDWLVVVGGWWWLVVVGGGWWCMWFFSWLVVWLDAALRFCSCLLLRYTYTYTTTTAYM